MTREQATKLLPIIQAYAEGKTVQARGMKPETNWVDADEKDLDLLTASFTEQQWRVKPEPREFWLSMELPDTGTFAKVYRQPVTASEYKTIIHVREVLE